MTHQPPPLWAHTFTPAGQCQRCGIMFLDAAGGCPVSPAGRADVSAATGPGQPPGTVNPGYPGNGSGRPGGGREGAGGGGPCRIRCLTYSPARTWARDPFAGMWLRNADPHANNGGGYSAWCRDLGLAAVFGDQQTAWDCWRAVSWRTVGGQPHKPLTAFAIELVAVSIPAEDQP